MTEEQRYDVLRRLLAQQHALRTVAEAAELQAELAKEAKADGLALSIFMLRESLLIYSKELSKFVRDYIGESAT